MKHFSIIRFFLFVVFTIELPGGSQVKACDGFVFYLFESDAGNDSLPNRNEKIHLNEFETEKILQPGESIKDKVKTNLFVVAQVSRSACFVGEPITVTYKLYTRLDVKSFIVAQPVLTGFNKNDILKVPSLDASLETVGGKKFQVHILRKTELIPMISGSLEIDPMEVQHRINFIKSDPDSVATGSQLTDFLQQKKKEEQALSTFAVMNSRSSPLRITVRDMPEENKPPGYSGAVGSFSIKAELSPETNVTGATRRLTVEIKGTGSLLLAEPPVISLPENIELLGVKPIRASHKAGPNSTTSRSFEYVLHFPQAGAVKIPAISFSYFDPIKRIYQTKYSMPIFTEILEKPGQAKAKVVRMEPARGAKKNIAHADSQRKNILLVFIIAIAGSVVLFWKKVIHIPRGISAWLKQGQQKRNEKDADTLDVRAVAKLSIVKNTDRSDLRTYYYELNRILWSVITEKVNLLPTELSKGNIFRELSRQGWTPEEIWELELTMNEYERNLYVPGYKDEDDFVRAYDNALRIITRLETLGQ